MPCLAGLRSPFYRHDLIERALAESVRRLNCEDLSTLGGGRQDRREHALHRSRARRGSHGLNHFGSLNHSQEQGINGQTACPLVEDEPTYGRHREIDAIDPIQTSGLPRLEAPLSTNPPTKEFKNYHR